jgi:hypothetical protein
MATSFQLLRRELSRCHDALGNLPSEKDYLSIIVLIEGELGIKNWKEVTRPELEALKKAIAIGMSEPKVTYDHYNKVFRVLNASGYNTGPIFEFGIPDGPIEEGLEDPPNE